MSIASRREMADLLKESREASARIRVENIIHTDITVELMEILELYAELLLARAGLLDMRDKNIKEGLSIDDTGLEEAAASIIYAAPRLPRDVRELGIVRAMLIERFGKEFATKANENVDNCVPERVVNKLKVDPPSQKLVQAYLEEIAMAYKVDWPKREQELEQMQNEVDDEDDQDGPKEPPIPTTPKKIDLTGLASANTPSAIGAKSPVSVAPPKATSENPHPKVNLPGGAKVDSTPKSVNKNILGAPPTVDDLAKRFSALKR